MDDAPDPYPLRQASPSLVDRLFKARAERPVVEAAPDSPPGDGNWPKAAGLFALLIAGPLVGLAVNRAEIAHHRGVTARLAATTTPREAAAAEARRGHAILAAALARPSPIAVAARLAQALPADARIAWIEQREGRLAAEIAVSDPDRLRTALRRNPALSRLRETGQRQGDGVLLVTLGERE